MSTPRRVPLSEVADLMAPGQPLPFKVLDSLGRMLLAAGQRVMDARQLAALLERGACVEYDDAQAVRQARAADAAVGALAPSSRKRTLFDRWEQQPAALEALLRMLGRDTTFVPQLEAFADDYVALVDKHVDAALFVCVRQDERRVVPYGLNHALHTATVALLCARHLGWAPERARCAMLAALTMNAASMSLQAQMAVQADPPTKKQLEQIRAHPALSAQMLRDSGVLDADWLAAVEDHHERAGGAGYPRGLAEVGEVAHLVRAADVFMAKITPRALRAHMPPQLAARQLFQEENGGPLAGALIRAVGIYPPGDFVRLKNGDAAVVVQRAGSGNSPLVASVQGPNGKPIPGAPRRDTALAEFAITGPLTDRKGLPRVLPEQVFGLIDA